jgi:hypothetical protein
MSLFCFIQATDLAGLLHLVKFYKSRRFDSDIGMPRSRSALCITCFPCCKLLYHCFFVALYNVIQVSLCFTYRPNDFHDVPEYFVLEVML